MKAVKNRHFGLFYNEIIENIFPNTHVQSKALHKKFRGETACSYVITLAKWQDSLLCFLVFWFVSDWSADNYTEAAKTCLLPLVSSSVLNLFGFHIRKVSQLHGCKPESVSPEHHFCSNQKCVLVSVSENVWTILQFVTTDVFSCSSLLQMSTGEKR